MNKERTSTLDAALLALRAAKLVILPTETVYGLVADAASTEAVAQIYALKQRPANKPLSLLVSDLAMAQTYGLFNARSMALARAYWPGPLTLVVPVKPGAPIAPALLAGGNSIGLRVPAQAQTCDLIARFGAALAAPSANKSGQPPPISTAQIDKDISASAAHIVDGGPCHEARGSTVLDLTGTEPLVLRAGRVSDTTGAGWKKQ